MNKVYVISDIHGHLSKFIKMLRMVRFDETDKLLILGNVLDAGPEPIQLLQLIMQHDNMKMCIGKHEIMFVDSVLNQNIDTFNIWTTRMNGALTYEQFRSLSETEQHQIFNYLKEKCPTFFTADNYILCNSMIDIYEKPTNPKTTEKIVFEDFLKQNADIDLINTSEEAFTRAGFKDKTVIFGGIPVQAIRNDKKDYKIWRDPIYNDKICINSGINLYPNKLSCICLNTDEDFYV